VSPTPSLLAASTSTPCWKPQRLTTLTSPRRQHPRHVGAARTSSSTPTTSASSRRVGARHSVEHPRTATTSPPDTDSVLCHGGLVAKPRRSEAASSPSRRPEPPRRAATTPPAAPRDLAVKPATSGASSSRATSGNPRSRGHGSTSSRHPPQLHHGLHKRMVSFLQTPPLSNILTLA